jgi:transketolase C-terminal domain/subunit
VRIIGILEIAQELVKQTIHVKVSAVDCVRLEPYEETAQFSEHDQSDNSVITATSF